MSRRPVVLAIVDYYLPGWRAGGAVRSLANLVELLGDEFSFKIITRDRDWRSDAAYPGIVPGHWLDQAKAEVLYLSPAAWRGLELFRELKRVQYDLLYLSSAFSPLATIRPLLLRKLGLLRETPVIVGPRGEFSPGAIAIQSAKKRTYLQAAKAIRLFDGLLWQASTPLESDDIRREIGSCARVIEAVDCSPAYSVDQGRRRASAKAPGSARICFAARISPKKNLEFAIEVLKNINGAVTFDVIGPVDSQDYWKRCLEAVGTLPETISFQFKGPVSHEAMLSLLGSYDLYFFPTLGENFGHSIVEALAAGCPVLISDRTPWRDLASYGVGWDLPLERPRVFVDVVQRVVSMTENEHARMRSSARDFALEQTNVADASRQNRAMFLQALSDSISSLARSPS